MNVSDFTLGVSEDTTNNNRSCAFKPHINPISSEIVHNKPRYEKTEEPLISYGKAVQEKLQQACSIQEAREVEGCTF